MTIETYSTATQRWNFGRGALPLMVLLPPLVYWMAVSVTSYGGAMALPTTAEGVAEFLGRVPLPTVAGLLLTAGWFGLQAALQHWAPGRWVEGTPLADGSRLKYRMNGWFSWWFTFALVAVVVGTGLLPATVLADEFGSMLGWINVLAFAGAAWLYVRGVRKGLGTGRPVYDYFMGTELNPRIGTFDLKLFCEARPGLILWVLVDLSFLAKQWEVHGVVSGPMLLVCAFHFLYVADYFFHEPAILTTMDIKHERFGWMLCWGDLVWVPFTYTLQAMYLVDHPGELPWWGLVGIVALNMVGYYVFRAVNIQKHHFRENPEAPIWGRKPTFIRTQRGTLLLTSGWWGLARHFNYLGDLMMGLAWCLPCGFGNLIPYFYIIYFTILLVHRERRDHEMCREKYGADWDRYCAQVRWRIVPGVY